MAGRSWEGNTGDNSAAPIFMLIPILNRQSVLFYGKKKTGGATLRIPI